MDITNRNYEETTKNNNKFIQDNNDKLREIYDMNYNNVEEYDNIMNILDASISESL